HLYISAISLGLGVIVAIPLGILLSRMPKLAKWMIGIASILQTVPSLALLALMIPLFGVGKLPAILALFIHGLLPILPATY
ncbi:choline ABC transporter permease, partial [Rhizobium sp. KAs_5_22]